MKTNGAQRGVSDIDQALLILNYASLGNFILFASEQFIVQNRYVAGKNVLKLEKSGIISRK